MPGKDLGGIVITRFPGIADSVIATWLGRVLGMRGPQQSAGFIMSVIGAIILLAICHMFKRPTA